MVILSFLSEDRSVLVGERARENGEVEEAMVRSPFSTGEGGTASAEREGENSRAEVTVAAPTLSLRKGGTRQGRIGGSR